MVTGFITSLHPTKDDNFLNYYNGAFTAEAHSFLAKMASHAKNPDRSATAIKANAIREGSRCT
jgi:hypothetical protein